MTTRTEQPGERQAVMISLTDVEPAVRLNAELERAGLHTAMVSPLDDVPGAMQRERPSVVVLTGALTDAHNVQLVRRALWDGVRVVGLSDVGDPEWERRLREVGYAEV